MQRIPPHAGDEKWVRAACDEGFHRVQTAGVRRPVEGCPFLTGVALVEEVEEGFLWGAGFTRLLVELFDDFEEERGAVAVVGFPGGPILAGGGVVGGFCEFEQGEEARTLFIRAVVDVEDCDVDG